MDFLAFDCCASCLPLFDFWDPKNPEGLPFFFFFGFCMISSRLEFARDLDREIGKVYGGKGSC